MIEIPDLFRYITEFVFEKEEQDESNDSDFDDDDEDVGRKWRKPKPEERTLNYLSDSSEED
jgi:hypothetical protein